jgi:hypothetical protein
VRRPPGPDVDALFKEVLAAGEDVRAQRAILTRLAPDDGTLRALLRRPVPVRLLELLGASAPWNERRPVTGGVALNPRTPRTLAMRLLPDLFWHDQAEAAQSPRLPNAVRNRAEGALLDQLPQMRLGERITLARMATTILLRAMLQDKDPRVLAPCLQNPRLREEELLLAVRAKEPHKALLEAVAASRWGERYAVRLALVMQPQCPLPLALAQLSSLLAADLRHVAATPGLHPLLTVAAERLVGQTPGAQRV